MRFIGVMASLVLLACGDGESTQTDVSDTDGDVGSLEILPSEPIVLGVGFEYPLAGFVEGTEVPEVEWESLTPHAEIVGAKIVGVSAGPYRIRGSLEGNIGEIEGSIVIPEWLDVSTDAYSTCGVRFDGEVLCFGRVDAVGGEFTLAISSSHPKEMDFPGKAVQVRTGAGNVCARTEEGRILCRGTNLVGSVGDGTREPRQDWTEILAPNQVFQSLDGSGYYFCALNTKGDTLCWGQTVGGTSATPTVIGGPYSEISVSMYHACGLREDRRVECWGWNYGGQLGNGTLQASSVPVRVVRDDGSVAEEFESIATGAGNSCALSDGAVYCWGLNENRSFWDDDISDAWPRPREIGKTGVTELHMGSYNSCALDRWKRRDCWGHNGEGLLGNGVRGGGASEIQEEHLWHRIDFDYSHGCGLTVDGKMHCWGADISGQLRSGRELSFAQPQKVGDGFFNVFAGHGHTCATKIDMSVWCWGLNAVRQLGHEDTLWSPVPRRYELAYMVTPIGSVVEVSPIVRVTGASNSSCITASSELWCWGNNQNAALGILEGRRSYLEPQFVSDSISEVSGGDSHMFGLRGTTWYGWGYALYFTLQDYLRSISSVPLVSTPEGNQPFIQISAGRRHSCGVVENLRSGVCVGNGENFGSDGNFQNLPGRWERLEAGYAHVCGILEGGGTQCFGSFLDGREATTEAYSIAGSYRSISTRGPFACGVDENRRVFCWGQNQWGNLGTEGEVSFDDPNEVDLPGPIYQLSVGGMHACAIVDDSLYCWGDNSHGQLGTEDVPWTLEPKYIEP